MTEFGKALWMVVQDKGPYSRAAFARVLGQRTGWEPSRQAVSNWLKGDREAPRELVPAVVTAFALDDAIARRLEHLYFYGQGDAMTERWQRAREVEEGNGDDARREGEEDDGAQDQEP